MGRLRYEMMVSLDGYVRDASGSFAWAEPEPELHAWVNEHERGVGTTVYGRGMWEMMRYWEDPPEADLTAQEYPDFTDEWGAQDKIIVSSTLEPPTTPRTRVWRDLDLDRLATLVRESTDDVSISGPTLAATALRAGLVDDVGAHVMPHVAGGGLPFLPEGHSADLQLRESRSFPSGAVTLLYSLRR